MNTEVMHDVMTESHAGNLTFPEAVRRLLQAGVESYFCDFAANRQTFYTANGQTHTESMTVSPGPIADGFSQPGLVAAIRGAQSGAIRYPEFVRQSTVAGVIGYWAFLAGKKVVYVGRQGEFHVEEFPRPKP